MDGWVHGMFVCLFFHDKKWKRKSEKSSDNTSMTIPTISLRQRLREKLRGTSNILQTKPFQQAFKATRNVSSKIIPMMIFFLMALVRNTRPALAMGAAGAPKGPVAPMKREEIIYSVSLFFLLFSSFTILHAVEVATTALYPWTVREFTDEEGRQSSGTDGRGVFKIFNDDITRVLTTILVTSMALSIYGEYDW